MLEKVSGSKGSAAILVIKRSAGVALGSEYEDCAEYKACQLEIHPGFEKKRALCPLQ